MWHTLFTISAIFLAGWAHSQPMLASIEDGRGMTVKLPTAAERIVSSSLASDEILQTLIPEDEDRLLAVSKFAIDPQYSPTAEATKKRKLKTFGPELESLLILKPDLVILASYNRPDFVQKLDAAGVKTFVLNRFDSLDDIKANIAMLGQLVGKREAAEALIAKEFAVLSTLKAPAQLKTVIAFSDNLILASANTMFDSLCKAAHVQNLASRIGLSGWAKVSQEALLSHAPDFVVVPVSPQENTHTASQKVIDHPTFGKLAAVKARRFIFLTSAHFNSVSQHAVVAAVALHHGAYGP